MKLDLIDVKEIPTTFEIKHKHELTGLKIPTRYEIEHKHKYDVSSIASLTVAGSVFIASAGLVIAKCKFL